MSVGAAEDLLRAVAGAAKLKRLCLQIAQLLNPAWIVARIRNAAGTTSYLSDGASNDQACACTPDAFQWGIIYLRSK